MTSSYVFIVLVSLFTPKHKTTNHAWHKADLPCSDSVCIRKVRLAASAFAAVGALAAISKGGWLAGHGSGAGSSACLGFFGVYRMPYVTALE